MMSLLSFFFSLTFLLLSISGYARSDKHPQLSKFGQKTLDHLPEDVENKLFAVNYKDKNDFEKTIKKGADVFGKVYGEPVPDKFYKTLTDIANQLKPKITSKTLFRAFANSVQKFLQDNGILNEGNVDQLAKKFASFLKTASDSLKSTQFSETEPAAVEALAKFLKYADKPPTEEKLVEFQEDLLAEGKKDLD